ncbi:putative serine protease K12H4.7 isoform X2 [Drosophila bipectinata]|uniref:putative serine protease K12H4.7 isoform X2 n=1 Tax=Drosophila bipectinata TaxID=42026 RepID=UPI0038B35E2C
MASGKLFIYLLISFFIGIQSIISPIEFRWIEQKLDHFNDSIPQTFQMRYMVKEDYFKPNKTIFFFMGGEGTILSPATNVSKIILTDSYMHDLAKEFNGYLIHSEHRYYGESKPKIRDLTVENLKYLSVAQALADVATLIRFQKANTTHFGDSKIFLVGGSYTGFLVPWFAKLYPELMDLGWGSSAPFEFKGNFKSFFETVFKIIVKIGGSKCHEKIIKGFKAIDLQHSEYCVHLEGEHCKDSLEKQTIFQRFTVLFAYLVQTGNKTTIRKACKDILETPFISFLRNHLIHDFKCTYQQNRNLEYKNLSFFEKLGINYTCLDLTRTLKNESYTTDPARLWFYQQCYELGNFQTTEYVPLQFYLDYCKDIFPALPQAYMFERIQNSDIVFEDLDENTKVSEIFLTQAEYDPWSGTKVRNHKRTYYLKDAFHCEDLRAKAVNNNPSIKKLKRDIYREVQKLQLV